MPSISSSASGLFLSSISLCQLHACICSGVMGISCPGVGVAIAIALLPTGVCPLGVKPPGVWPPGVMPEGVIPPGVMEGVCWLGVIEGVALPPPGVIEGVMAPPPGVATCGVRSQRERRLLALGVGVSWMRSGPPVRSVLGVSAQPAP